MKRLFRYVSLVCLCLLSISFMTSCVYLDGMKEVRAEWLTENQERIGIEFQDKYYYPLDNPNNYTILFARIEYLKVVERDVPLLLTKRYGVDCAFLSEEDILRYDGVYYASDEKYEQYSEYFRELELDHYKTEYSRWNGEEGRQEIITKVLDEKITALIKDTLKNGNYVSGGNMTDWTYLWLDDCDSIGRITKENTVRLFKNADGTAYGIITSLYDEKNVVYFKNEDRPLLAKLFKDNVAATKGRYTY